MGIYEPSPGLFWSKAAGKGDGQDKHQRSDSHPFVFFPSSVVLSPLLILWCVHFLVTFPLFPVSCWLYKNNGGKGNSVFFRLEWCRSAVRCCPAINTQDPQDVANKMKHKFSPQQKQPLEPSKLMWTMSLSRCMSENMFVESRPHLNNSCPTVMQSV